MLETKGRKQTLDVHFPSTCIHKLNQALFIEPGLVVHTCNPSTQEDCKFEASLGYVVRICLKKTKPKLNTYALWL
jgi:hypothetical protein